MRGLCAVSLLPMLEQIDKVHGFRAIRSNLLDVWPGRVQETSTWGYNTRIPAILGHILDPCWSFPGCPKRNSTPKVWKTLEKGNQASEKPLDSGFFKPHLQESPDS